MVVTVSTFRLVHMGANEKVRPAQTRASIRPRGAARRRITSISTNEPTSRTAPSRCPRAPEVVPTPTPLFVIAAMSARIEPSREEQRPQHEKRHERQRLVERARPGQRDRVEQPPRSQKNCRGRGAGKEGRGYVSGQKHRGEHRPQTVELLLCFPGPCHQPPNGTMLERQILDHGHPPHLAVVEDTGR